jgi:ParB family transcriptional regulator, chromosome partitioning protein
MSKTDTMQQQVGAYLDASVGKREGVATPPTEGGTNAAQFEGRVRHRNACLITLDRIEPDPDQPRKSFSQEELEQLAHSLKTKGQLQPIRVRWEEGRGRYVIVMGERRWRAAKIAGLGQIECVVHEAPLTEDERFELALVENVFRQDLNPIEQAHAFETLLAKRKCSARSLAQELRLNVSTLSRSLSLLKLPADIQDAIASGRIPPGIAREVAKLENEPDQRAMVERFFAEGLTSADAAAAVSGKALQGKAETGTKKTITVPGGLKIVITGKKKHSGTEIVEALRQAIEILESDGRGRGRKAAA